jgi:hypothetical protein
MEPPNTPPPPPPSPFQPINPGPAPVPGKTGGCGKPVVIGCLILLVLTGIGLVLLLSNAPKLLDWAFGQMERGILAQLPPDVTPEEKERLQKAFADVSAAAKNGTADPAELQDLQRKIMQISSKRPLTRQDVLDLTRELEEAAGKTTGEEPPG